MAEIIEVAAEVVEKWGRPRIGIGGQDYTWVAGRDGRMHTTVPLTTAREDPFSYAEGAIVFPGFDPHLDRVGEGRWREIRRGNGVRISIVGDGDSSPEDLEVAYRGNIASWRATSRGLEVILEGRLLTALHNVVPPTIGHVQRETVEGFCKRILDGVRGRRFLPLRYAPGATPTGIPYSARGDYASPVAMVTDALAATHGEYTIRWDEVAGPEFTRQEPRTTWTVTFEQPGMQADLVVDPTAVLHAVYGRGIAPNGGEWRGSKYPEARTAVAPPYPRGTTLYYPGQTMPAAVGGPFWEKMREHGYRIASTPTFYDPADREDVIALQEEAGIASGPSGSFGPQTWAAVFQPGMGAALGEGFIYPLAAARSWDRYLRNPRGAILGPNPDYDPKTPKQERQVDFGDGITLEDARRSARQMIRREAEPLVSGTVTLTADPEEGFRARIREGDRLRVRDYMGETIDLHIARVAVDWTSLTVTLEVANRRGTYSTIAAEIEQRQSERQSRRQANGQPVRSPGVVWDVESPAGRIYKTSHYPGLGSVTYVPMPIFGQVVRTRIRCDAPSEFIAAVFNRPVTVAEVENLIGGNPFSITERSPVEGRERRLKQAGMVIWWGSEQQPLGYGSEYRPDSISEAEELLDGTFEEDAAWDFRIPEGQPPYLCLVTWTREGVHTSGRFYATVSE